MKKTTFLLFVIFFMVSYAQAQSLTEKIQQADDLYADGKYKEAFEIYEKEIANKANPRDTVYAQLLSQCAWAYVDEYNYQKAEPLFIEAKNIREKVFGKNSKDYALSCGFLSLMYYYQGQYKKAEPLCIEAKTIREKVLGKDNARYANSCVNLADIYNAQGLFKKAEPLYLEGIAIREKLSGKDKNYLDVIKSLGNLYYDIGSYGKAEQYYIEAKTITEKLYGKEHGLYPGTCHNLGVLYLERGVFSKAEPLFIEAMTVIEKLGGKQSLDYARPCNSLANLYTDLGKFDKAEALYIETKNIQEKVAGKNNNEYASSCDNLAVLYRDMNLFEKAEPLYVEAKNIREKLLTKNHIDYTLSCSNLAGLYAQQGFTSKAEALYLEAKSIQEKLTGKENSDYALYCYNLATLYLDRGMFVQAEPLFIEAKNIRERIWGKEHMDYASSCNGLANLYADQGLYSKAEPLYLEAKNIREKIFGKTHAKYATSCNNLANLYFDKKEYSKAEQLFIEAKNIQEIRLGKSHTAYAMSCNNLASVYVKKGLHGKVEALYLEAMAAQEKTYGKESMDYALTCFNLAGVYRRQGNYKKAEEFYIESKNIREKLVGKEHPLYASACHNLANLYASGNLYQKAAPLHKEAIANKLKQIDELLPTLSEKERNEFFRSIDYYFKRYYEFVLRANLPDAYADLFNLQLTIKGLIFQSTQKMQNQIMKSGNTSLVQKYEDWKVKKIAYNNYMQLSLTEKSKKVFNADSLSKVINDLERQLSIESEAFAAIQGKKKITWKDVQKKLLPNEAAVEIIRTDSAYLALIVKPSTIGNPEVVVFTNGKEMDKRLINYYRNCITNKIEDAKSYTNFWGPIQEKLGEASKIYVSADGVYHQLNLLTLKNPKTSKYLLDEKQIQLVSNLKDLMQEKKEVLDVKYENYKIHLIAYPKYDGGIMEGSGSSSNNELLKGDTTQRFYGRGGEIVLLPGTKVEASKIEALCVQQNITREVKLLEEASEQYIKSLSSPTILHIATHGFFMPTPTAKSGQEEDQNYSDPLLNSGLLLANAKQGMAGWMVRGEDGVLTAKEALNLSLDKTSLVVMSACETGLGEIRNGEGVYGLQRSFQQAGAKTIIISLWKVSDEATQELMSSFYDNLLSKKMTKRQAFQSAQSSLIQKYPEPYFWGAFVMIGE